MCLRMAGQQPSAPWHTREDGRLFDELGVDPERGLGDEQAAQRLVEYGPNELEERGLRSPARILWEQFTATLVVILIVAAVVAASLGEHKDATAIFAIVVLFGVLGFVQEYRAERAMAALKRLAVPSVRVRRGGEQRELSTRNLVPGDVVLLEAGNVVPADGRVIESANLRVQEAALTGESEPVYKRPEALDGADLALGDRSNMAYFGTVVSYGRGAILVVETGMRTEIGRIADLLGEVKAEQTPLQRRLDQVGKVLAVVGVAVAIVVSVLGLLRGESVRDMLLLAVSIAVAVVPEGLPAVVTITLALGAQRMLRRNALIRRLPAVETLGSVTVICSDKTGTLTENRMTVVLTDVAGQRAELLETMSEGMPSLEGQGDGPPSVLCRSAGVRVLLTGGALCNDALLRRDASGDSGRTTGDPTEAALLVAAARAGLFKESLERALPRVAEAPFDSDRKRMTTVHEVSGQLHDVVLPPGSDAHVAFSKGAVDSLLEHSTAVLHECGYEPMTDEWQARIRRANDELAEQGMRVLGVAVRSLPDWSEPLGAAELEQDLAFVGMVGIIDPPRSEVADAVATCQTAGIRPVMITGDHPRTARRIATDLGITRDGRVLTGQDLGRMTDEVLVREVESTRVYARVSPEHKLRIVQALQSLGHVVAMTGDGVNDAPALKRAQIGVAMGIAGTDVAKEASDMVLQDDNFATIVAAVQEGRTIYDNLRKFVKFSVAGNLGKVAVMLIAPMLGAPLPLTPLQLLWLNLLTDGLLGLGLGVEPAERGVMQRPPTPPESGVFSDGGGRHVVWVGLTIGAVALALGFASWISDPDGHWRTMTFTTLALAQVAQALAARSSRDSLFTLGLRSNLPATLIVLATVGLQLMVVFVPFFQGFFGTAALSPSELALCVGLSSLVFIGIELEKWRTRLRERR